MSNVKCSMNMVNVGVMSKLQLNRLLRDLAVYDGSAIERGEIYITVTIDGRKVLGAARVNSQWHVRALEGLILVAPAKSDLIGKAVS